MNLELVTLGGVKVSEDIYSIVIPTVEGPIGVYPGHEPLVTLADNGVIAIKRRPEDEEKDIQYLATYGGIVEISPERVRILVDEADTADEIIEEEAKLAYEAAQNMKKTAQNEIELEKALAAIDRHAVRLKVAGLRRRQR